jgi:hypothetical protein
MKYRISADMGQMAVPPDGNLEPQNPEDKEIDEDGVEWTPSYSQTRILRREPTSSFTRVLRHSLDKAREFSTIGHNILVECPECKALMWNDFTARIGHVNYHKFIDEQLGIPPDEMAERNWAIKAPNNRKAMKRNRNSR